MTFFTLTSFFALQKKISTFSAKFSLMLLMSILFTALNAQVTVSLSKTDASCNGYTNGSATATATGGTSPYTYKWSLGTTGSTLSGLSAGTYGVTATDANGKTGSASITVNQPNALNLNISFADICNNGTVTALASGGTGAFSYNWGNGITGSTQNNLAKGGYNVLATDANGCAVSKFIINPGTFSISLKIGKLRCFGDCDAAIDALPTGGTAPISYKWNTGVATQSIVGIPSGTYSVTATDANGCTSSATGTVANPPQINISVTVNSPSCGGGANGSATATATGGTGAITFKWSNGQTTATATGLNVGTYSVTATDANGCSKETSVNIVTKANFSVSISKTDASCGSSNGSATVTASGTTGTVSYLWSTNATTSSISNLPAGTYSVTVTDGTGCSNSASTTVNAVGNLSIALTKTDASCGITNGIISVTVLTGTAPYKYAWSNGAKTATINLLAAGTYSVTVTDANSCTAVQSAAINSGSSLTVNLSNNNVSCFGGNDGQATVMVQGGSTPYKYNWSNGGLTATIGGLVAGTYSVTVSDNFGCSNTGGIITVTQPTQLNVNVSTTNNSCGAPSGSATASVSGGTAPYTYKWSNGATSSSISNLSGGTYTVSVFDAKGCSVIANATVNSVGNLSTSISKTDATCGNPNGTATVSVLTGTAPYKYAWSNGAITAAITGLAAGTYSVTVSDANNCTSVQTAVISAGSNLTISITANNVSCYGGNNGQATVAVQGGTQPYKFIWSNGATVNTIVNLIAGNYAVTVTDYAGCTTIGTIAITQGSQIIVNTTTTNAACGSANGSATASVSGGTAPYQYQWSNGSTSNTISNVAGGTYSLTVTDANNCTATGSATVISSGSNIKVTVSSSNGNCSGQGSAAVSVSGGTAPYNYKWSTGSTAVSISNLITGNYSVIVTDAGGCSAVQTFAILTPTPIAVTVNASGATCGNKNGSITTSVSGGTAPYTYLWSNGATTANISNLNGGTYSVIITDANGCKSTTTLTVTQTSGITLTTSTTNATCVAIGSASVVASGGSGTYTYKWSNGGTSATISNILGGNYTVIVTDGTCSQTATVTVPSVTSNLTCAVTITRAISSFNGSDGVLTVSVTGGVAPFAYTWSNGYTATNVVDKLVAGTYTVTVTDKNGCTTSCSATLTNPTCDNVTNAGTITGDQKYCTASQLTPITEVTPATGGSGALIYLWMYSDVSDVFNMSSWNVVQGATGPNLTVLPVLTKTTFFRRCVRRAGCPLFLESNAVMKMPISNVNFTAPTPVCLNQNVIFTAPDNGPFAQYNWSFAFGSPSNAFTRSVTVKFTLLGPANVLLNVNVGGCSLEKNITVTVTNCAVGSGTISAFSATAESTKKVILNWQTTAETESSSYAIERSPDGSIFNEIGRMSSHNQAKNTYQFFDTDPKMGHSFYRIKHLDNSGGSALSDMRQIILHNGDLTAIAYPNPVNSKLFVELTDVEKAEGNIEVYNVQGIMMKTQKFTQDQVRYEIDMSELPSGNYYIKLTQNDGTIKTVKASKQ